MDTNCAPLLADIFLYSYEAEFIQSLLSPGKKRLASQFNFTYRYIDDVLSINNPDFENYLGQMYPPELDIKDTTESNTSASYLDLLLSIGRDGQLRTSLYDIHDDFNFHITNFLFKQADWPTFKSLCSLQLNNRTFESEDPIPDFSNTLLNKAEKTIPKSSVLPREGPGVKSRMCPPYPQRDRKRRLNGAVCRYHRIKRVVPCRCRTGTLKTLRNVYGVGSQTVGKTSSSIRLHICAVIYITEISLM